MPFENFYEESDKAARHRWKILGLLVLAIFGYICFVIFVSSNKPTQAEIEKIIKNSNTLTRLDQLCMNDLPKPQNFYFRYKKLSGNSNTAAISYQFESERSYEEIEGIFRVWFNSNGWTADKDGNLEFKKTNQKVHIMRVAFPDADYSIYCAEEVK